ncbi:restriction endonuclease subunit S [Bacillus altitudinis]|uniref:restriction endonuclease subunit S n=1 Tax=Bacillus altitudinis TaxID=293387 RepID=UPI001F15E5F8
MKSIEELLEEALVGEAEQPYEVPENWIWSIAGAVTKTLRGVSYKKHQVESLKNVNNSLILRGGNIQDGKLLNQDDNVYVPKELVKEEKKLKIGDVVIVSSTGSSKVIGKAASVSSDFVGESFGAFLTTIRPSKKMDNGYFSLFYQTSNYRNMISNLAKGSNINNIKREHLDSLPFPLPPLDEQKRIADKVGRLLSKIDEAKQLIKEAKETFELRRAAILDKAFRGELTKKWRQNNKDILPVKQFLENIVLKRKETYTEIYERAKRNKEKKPRKIYMDTVPIIDEVVPFLPETWTVTNVEFLGHVTKLAGFEYTKYINLKPGGDVPVIRAQNVQMGKFVKSNIMYIDKDTSDLLSRSQVQEDDILMVFIGAGTGNVCIAPNRNGERWHLAPNVAKISVDAVLPKYLELYLQSPFGQAYIKSKMKATAQPSLSMETIREVLVYLPPLEEQKEIVKTVESLINKVENEVGILKSCSVDGLKQSILSKAFRGELGTNDPSEESAVELLKEVLQEQVK